MENGTDEYAFFTGAECEIASDVLLFCRRIECGKQLFQHLLLVVEKAVECLL